MALTKALLAPVRIRSRLVRWPSTAPMASMTMLLPAPVSPVRALKPPSKEMSASSMTAIFSMCSSCSIVPSPYLSISWISSQKVLADSVSRISRKAVSSPASVPTM